MRKLAVVLALASTALATPSLARDKAWYVGVEGGAMVVEDLAFDVTPATGLARPDAIAVDSEYGWDVDGIVGYDFGWLRAEAEVGYRQANVESLRTTVRLPYTIGSTTTTTPTGEFEPFGGRTSALSFMVNLLIDFGDDDGFQGYVGGGAGVARVKFEDYRVFSNASPLLDDSDTVFAWQGIAGVRAPLSENIDVGLKYRFFNADNAVSGDEVTVVNNFNDQYETRFRSHSLLGSLIFNFGAPEEAPPPPPLPPVEAPPPPPPPLPITECTPGPYIVFFEWDKSDITPDAATILDNAVSAYQTCGNAQVMLAGHADKSGPDDYNVGLSERRNASVRAYLGSRGIPDGVISTQAFGESAPRVETADGVRELQNRRVEITYGPGSGM